MSAGLAQRVWFDLTCPVCGADMEVVALGKSYRTEAGMVVRCSAMNCRCDFALRVHLMPNGSKSTSRLSGAIRRDTEKVVHTDSQDGALPIHRHVDGESHAWDLNLKRAGQDEC